MKLTFTAYTEPRSEIADEAIELVLQSPRFTQALEYAIKRAIEEIMVWHTIRVCVERVLP